ncbi:hypothetical protein DVH24_039116 [Malus domestica]|uniref:ubiquitinyl hydrolase 1 n=1 Tax=Malus domestica TaxID=3750 RepID=A0A498KH04_MALDO|nr:hypothetical protein DVH24_039116 [Malus domestica]
MTRILVQRGSSSGSSSNPTRPSSLSGSSSAWAQSQVNNPQALSVVKDEEIVEEAQENVFVDELPEYCGSGDNKAVKNDDLLTESCNDDNVSSSDELAEGEKVGKNDIASPGELMKGSDGVRISERVTVENVDSSSDSLQNVIASSQPPPPPVPPPPKLSSANSNSRRSVSGSSNAVRIGPSRRAGAWPVVSTRTSPNGSLPSSPRSHGESEGYNSADEHSPCFVSSYDDTERERQFEIDIRRAKGFEVKRMLEDGNCLFRAVADQVYGDSEAYDLIRQMCIDYMKDLPLIVKGKEETRSMETILRSKPYLKCIIGPSIFIPIAQVFELNNDFYLPSGEIFYSQCFVNLSEFDAEPINIFHGSYDTDTPPLRLSYHHGNHYNSLVDPRRQTIGVGLGFSRLRGMGSNVDKDQVKAAIKAQQDQQIDNASILMFVHYGFQKYLTWNFMITFSSHLYYLQALLAEGRFYSDLELTEKEIERMVMEASRLEYADGTFKQQLGRRESSTSSAEPSSSGARSSGSETKVEEREQGFQDSTLSSSMQVVLSMGFSYLQVIEAYSIFGDDVDSMVCYLLETSSSSRRKGKATE